MKNIPDNSLFELFDAITKNMTGAEIKACDVMAEIAYTIHMQRLKLGLSQKELAKKLNVSQARISKWESGECNFTIKTLVDIYDKLELNFEFQTSTHPISDCQNEYLLNESDSWEVVGNGSKCPTRTAFA